MCIRDRRAFDCKNPDCAQVMEGAPKITDCLCDECRAHYQAVKELLEAAGVTYVEDPTLVRGLDYYTRTVFEVQVVDGLGSQNAIGGGGRYDKLAEEVGGRPTPGLGFALGYERCVLALQAAGVEFPQATRCEVFVACVDDSVQMCIRDRSSAPPARCAVLQGRAHCAARPLLLLRPKRASHLRMRTWL